MADANKSSELKLSNRCARPPRQIGRGSIRAPQARTTLCPAIDSGGTVAPNSAELDRLYNSLSSVTAENHPRTARLLASSTRKVAQKVIEEAGEVALETVKRRPRGIVRESADLLYQLVTLWHRAGVRPDQVWAEMRCRADALGIAEKLPKLRHQQLASKAETAQSKTKAEGDQP